MYLGIDLERQEAIQVLKELLDNYTGLDGHGLEVNAPNATQGYQITIRGILNEETKQHIQNVASTHQLAIQTGSLWRTRRSPNKTEPDTLIIYKSTH